MLHTIQFLTYTMCKSENLKKKRMTICSTIKKIKDKNNILEKNIKNVCSYYIRNTICKK